MEFRERKEDIIGELTEYIIDYRGKTPKKSPAGIPTLSAKSVKNNRIDYSEVYYISNEEYKRFMIRGFPKVGDVLLTMEAPLGLVATLDRADVGLAQRIVTMSGKKGTLDNRYFKYYLQSPEGQHELLSRATGTTVIGISQKNLRNVKIKFPRYSTQLKIANILEQYDKKIEINNKIIANLESQAQAIFKYYFIDFEPFADGNFVESELGEIPEGWEVKKLKEKNKRLNGFTYKSVDLNDKSNYNMVTIKNFNRYGGQPNDAEKPINITDRVKEHHYLKNGDIIVACTDLTQAADIIGRVIYYDKNDKFEKEIYSMDVVKIVPKEADDNIFLYYSLKSNRFKDYASSIATGTTVLHFPKSGIDKYIMIYPPKNIIKSFSKIVDPIICKQHNLKRQNQTLAQTRDALLPKLMAGEIDLENIGGNYD